MRSKELDVELQVQGGKCEENMDCLSFLLIDVYLVIFLGRYNKLFSVGKQRQRDTTTNLASVFIL